MIEDILGEFKIVVAATRMNDNEDSVEVRNVYSLDGGYIGMIKDLEKLLDRGIIPELASPTNSTCSIGKSFHDGKWYGWSHRAIYGFKIGDKVEEGDCCASSGLTDEYLKEHPDEDLSLPVGFEAKTEDDAKRMAIAFADSVS